MLTDTRYALRGFRRSPGLASVAVLSLAWGIGANTAIFGLVNAILVRSMAVHEPAHLVIFTRRMPDHSVGNFLSPTLYQQLRDKNSALAGFASVTSPPMTISGEGRAEHVNGQTVSGNYFETLGVPAAIGRVLTTADDDIPDGPQVCVISYGLWLRRFGGDVGVIGRKIGINGQAFVVLGVTPEGFTGFNQGVQIDVSVPSKAAGIAHYNALQTFGRLKPGVSVARAQAELEVLYHQFDPGRLSRGRMSDSKVVLEPGAQGLGVLRSKYGRPLLMLMVAVGLVLLIACANVANLMMARASARAREIAVRLALGAARARLIRQFLAESLVLSAGGAVLGTGLAYWVDHALLAAAPRQMGTVITLDAKPDWRVFLFTLGVGIVVSVLAGIAPGIQSERVSMGPALKGGTGLRAPGRISLANALVVLQVGSSLVLLIGAGLFLRSLHNIRSVDPGFDPEHMVVLTIEPALSGYSQQATQNFFDRLVERARTQPYVVSVSPANVSPLSDYSTSSIRVPGYERLGEYPEISINWIGPEYFKTLGTPLVAGRVFTEQDGRADKVAIVNEKTVAHFWPQESPLGKHVTIGRRNDDFEIVGVVKDVKSASLREEAQETVYIPFRQSMVPLVRLHVRVTDKAASVISALMHEIHDLDPNLAAYNPTTMEAQLDGSIALDRLMGILTSLFAVLAAVLAAVGLYAVMAFAVVMRTREIGIRMALGAGRFRVVGQVMGESAVITTIGISLGIPAALWASRWVASFLFGLSAADPWTYVVVALALTGIALGAAWVPARQAAQVDPVVALRCE